MLSSIVRARAHACALLFAGLAVGCGPKPGDQPTPAQPPPGPPPAAQESAGEPAGGECSVDADCVPAACCHPASCVPAANKPDCTDVMCTMQCAPDTLDCGGRCTCEAGSCKAIFGTP